MARKDDELLSLTEAAEIAKYDPGSLRALAIARKFPARKVGKQWTITRQALERWMQSEHYRPGQKGRPSKNR